MKHCSAHTGYCGLQFWLKYMYFSFSWRHERVFFTLLSFMNSFKMWFPLQDIVTIIYFGISHANISLYIPRPKQIQTKNYIYTLHRTRLEAYILGPVLLPTLSWYLCSVVPFGAEFWIQHQPCTTIRKHCATSGRHRLNKYRPCCAILGHSLGICQSELPLKDAYCGLRGCVSHPDSMKEGQILGQM